MIIYLWIVGLWAWLGVLISGAGLISMPNKSENAPAVMMFLAKLTFCLALTIASFVFIVTGS